MREKFKVFGFKTQRNGGEWPATIDVLKKPNSDMIFLQDLSKLQIKAIKESLKGFFVANLCHVSSLYFTERRPFESGTTESLLGMETLTEELMGKKFQVF